MDRQAVLDVSTLTGESLPVTSGAGTTVSSGSSNAGEAFDLRAVRTAADSAYSGIVRLVREAARERAPFVRLADRYAALLLPVTLVVAAAAWALSGDPVRALAVLVVATLINVLRVGAPSFLVTTSPLINLLQVAAAIGVFAFLAPDLRIADGTAASVFRVAAARGPVSRDVAAKVTGLSIATVNRQVSALLSAGLLR